MNLMPQAEARIRMLSVTVFKHLPKVCFVLFFAWISFFPQPVQDQYASQTLAGLWMFFLLLAFHPGCKRKILSLDDWPFWFFLALLVLNIMTATDRNVAWQTYYLLASRFFLVFYIGRGIFLYEKNRNSIIFVICIFSGAVAFLGVLETLVAVNPIYIYLVENCYYERYISGIVRPMSTLLNPAVLGTYLLLALPFEIYVLKRNDKIHKIIGFCSLVFTGACLLLTFSRGAVLGALSMMLFFLWMKNDRKRLLVYGSTLILCLCVMAFLPYPFCRFSTETLLNGAGLGLLSSYRWARFEMVMRMLAQAPAFGIGLGHIRLLFHTFYPLKSELPFIGFEHRIADNMHLTLIAETGILGFCGFLFFIFFLLKNGFRKLKDLSGGNSRTLLSLMLLAPVGILVNMTGYELFYWANPYMFFCLICGFIQGLVEGEATAG